MEGTRGGREGGSDDVRQGRGEGGEGGSKVVVVVGEGTRGGREGEKEGGREGGSKVMVGEGTRGGRKRRT